MKWFKKHKIFTAFLLIFLLLIGTVVGYVYSKLSLIQYGNEPEVQAGSSPTVPEETEAEELLVDIGSLETVATIPVIPDTEIQQDDDIVNILVLGTDERSKELNVNARSDAMILVSINKTDKTVKLVSLERGMGVPILEGEYAGEYELLTHIFRYGGAELVRKTVEHCFRIEVDYYVRVNFTTVTTVVDAIGGIDIYLDLGEADALNRANRSNHHPLTNLDEGMNHLDGTTALHFARLRSIDSDWYRIERQRRVILAAVESLKGASLKELNDLLDQTLPLIQTNMTMLEIAELMLYSPNFLNSEFDQRTIPEQGTYGGMSGLHGKGMFAVDFETNIKILKEFLYGTAEEETTAPTQ